MYFSKRDMKFFEKARQIAETSDFERVKVGCVATLNGRIIGQAANSNKTHPEQMRLNKYRTFEGEATYSTTLPKLHAEVQIYNQLRHLDINFSKVSVYVYRICKDRQHGLAKPCEACTRALKELGIKNVYYSTNDGFAYERFE